MASLYCSRLAGKRVGHLGNVYRLIYHNGLTRRSRTLLVIIPGGVIILDWQHWVYHVVILLVTSGFARWQAILVPCRSSCLPGICLATAQFRKPPLVTIA